MGTAEHLLARKTDSPNGHERRKGRVRTLLDKQLKIVRAHLYTYAKHSIHTSDFGKHIPEHIFAFSSHLMFGNILKNPQKTLISQGQS